MSLMTTMPPNDDRSEVMCSDTTVEDVPSFIVGKSTTPTPALRPSSDMSHKVMSAALNLLQLPLFPQTKQIERFNPRSHAIGGLHRIKQKSHSSRSASSPSKINTIPLDFHHGLPASFLLE